MGTTSFSMEVKEEMIKNLPQARHCRIAEIAVIIAACGFIQSDSLIIKSDNERITQKYFTLLKKTFNIIADAFEQKGFFEVSVNKKEEVLEILQAVKVLDSEGNPDYHKGVVASVLLKSSCCKRVFLRSAFTMFGSVNAPDKGSHLEFVCDSEGKAKQITRELSYFDINAKIGLRKNRFYVVYIKDADTIQDVLNVLDAHNSLMEFVNARILKDVRNDLNRRNNCDIGNISRAVNAGSKQIDDIRLIEEKTGLDALPPQLMEIAKLRLENPESSLTELGEMLDPKVGKSGVNHRLRKIGEFAESLRQQ